MKKEIKVLIKKESAKYSSESISFGGNKFKIVAENDNSYSHLSVYIYSQNGSLEKIACEYDIPNYKHVQYYSEDMVRCLGNANNIKAAEVYIKKVYND